MNRAEESTHAPRGGLRFDAVHKASVLWAGGGALVLHYVTSVAIAFRGFESPHLERFSALLIVLAVTSLLLNMGLQLWKRRPLNWLAYEIFSCVMVASLIYSWVASRSVAFHRERARQHDRQCEHSLALQEYRWLTEKWWYRVFGQRDAFSPLLMSVARTACEVGDFELARRSYERIIANEEDEYWRKRANEDLGRLQRGLEMLDIYHRWMGGDKTALHAVSDRHRATPPDPAADEVRALYDMALALEYDLGSQAKAKEVYERILGMDVSDIRRQVARRWLDEWAQATPKAGP